MKKVTLLLLLSITILSCTKGKIINKEIGKTQKWQQHTSFRGDNSIQTNSQVFGDYLFISGPGSFYYEKKDSEISHSSRPMPLTLKKMPISNNYYLFLDQYGSLHLRTNRHPETESVVVSISDWDTDFERFDFPSHLEAEAIVVNSKEQALLTYVIKGQYGKTVKLLLFDLKTTYVSKKLNVVQNQAIDIADNHAVAIKAIDDHFYFTSNKNTYRIDSKGNLTKLNINQVQRFVEQNGVIYGIGQSTLYRSTDNGLTWNTFAKNSDYLHAWSFTKVGDKIAIHRFGQISQIEFTLSGYHLKPLDNKNLNYKQITSISEFNGNVYATTLSGVYTKKMEDFFEKE